MIKCGKILDFYTNHAIIYHILHLLNIIPSTYLIALLVFIFGTILQLYHDGKQTDGTEEQKARLFALHAIPLFLIKDKSIQIKPLIISGAIYLIYIGSFKKLKKIYSNMYKHLYN